MAAEQDLVDPAAEKAVRRRMRRGEPAPTVERAAYEEALARRILHLWWTPWAYLALAVVWVGSVLLEGRSGTRLVSGMLAAVFMVGLAAWKELHRRGAARLLDANRQRWGDL